MEITSTSAIGTSYSSILSSLKCFLSYVVNSDMLIVFYNLSLQLPPFSIFGCRCKSYERARKKMTILEAPNVLTIALKRYQVQFNYLCSVQFLILLV